MQKYIQNYLEYFNYGEQDYIKCEYCKKQGNDIHHIIYRSQQGNDDISNLICLCRDCHDRAHYKTKPYLDHNILQKKHNDYIKLKKILDKKKQ